MQAERAHVDERPKIAHWLARGALRLGDQPRLEQAVRIIRESPEPPSLGAQARREWVLGMTDGSDGRTVESAARRLEELGLLVPAADAWADAALLAARAGRTSVALDRATALIARIGMHPLLGPLPETRWLEPVRHETIEGVARG